MPSKIKNLYKKARGLKNIVSRKAKSQEAKSRPPHSKDHSLKLAIQENSDKEGTKVKKERFKGIKEKIKSLKTKSVEKELGKGNVFKNGFKKLTGKIKKLNPIKSKKNKIIGSKKLAFLLTAGTIVAILPMFNLTPFPALAITSACVFSINFIAVKTLKKAIKQRKAKSKEAEAKKESTVAESEKPKEEIKDVSVQPVAESSKQISRE